MCVWERERERENITVDIRVGVCIVMSTAPFSMSLKKGQMYWIEVMANASNLEMPQRHRASQRLVGTDYVILVTAAGPEKLRVLKQTAETSAFVDVCRVRSRNTMPKWKELEVPNETWNLQLILKKWWSDCNRFVNQSTSKRRKKGAEEAKYITILNSRWTFDLNILSTSFPSSFLSRGSNYGEKRKKKKGTNKK